MSTETIPPKVYEGITLRTKGWSKGDTRKFDFERLADLCHRYRIDPAEVVLRALKDDSQLSLEKRVELAEKAMRYLYAQRKSLEISGEIRTHARELSDEELLAIITAGTGEEKTSRRVRNGKRL